MPNDEQRFVSFAGQMGLEAALSQLEHVRKRYEAGNPLALYDAVDLCERGNIALPEWVNQALKEFIFFALTEPKKGTRGRSNSPLGKVRETLKTFARQSAVWNVRNWQQDRESAMKGGAMPWRAVLLWYEGQLDHYSNSIEDAIEIAKLGLEGTFAEGSYETIRKAYFKKLPDESFINSFSLYPSMKAFGLVDDRPTSHVPPPHIQELARKEAERMSKNKD